MDKKGKRYNFGVEEEEEWPEWLTEGLEQEEIEGLMSAAKMSQEERSQDLIEIKPTGLSSQRAGEKQCQAGKELASEEREVCLDRTEEQIRRSEKESEARKGEGGEETKKVRWGRSERAEKLAEFEQAYREKPSHRHLAAELGVPRTTLQHWLKRKERIDAEPEVVAFFESPTGVAFLHRLVLGSHFVFSLMGPCGIRLVCRFLELSGLDQFVAASYSPQQKVSVAMEEAVLEFEQQEKERLGASMAAKQITVCEDETFQPEICLVAIEPVSNFILLEKHAPNRKAQEWDQALAEATAGLPVEIIQSTSDEGRGIVCHVKKGLGAHHSPDLFHVQQEVVKGASVALSSRNRQALKGVEKATEKVSRYQALKRAYLNDEGRTDCSPGLEKKIKQAQQEEDEAKKTLETAAAHQEQIKLIIQGIRQAYHPYDLQTGAARSAEVVSASLTEQFSALEALTTEANLSERCFKRIQKAERVVGDMVATIAFFWLTLRAKIDALSLPPAIQQAVYITLIPAIYLHLVAHKVKTPEEKRHLLARSERLLAPLLASDGPFAGLDKDQLLLIEQVATECAHLFQRSSSCVEGRNGHLALFHHSLHRLSNRKLAALTTVHNYFLKRPDDTSAAQRFFGAKPKDLFAWVLARVDLPGRPAQKRSLPQQKTFLLLDPP